MNHWLVKSEPSCYSWDDMKKDDITHWDGVRNYQARNNMRAMKNGDLVFFYHSIKEKRIMGIVKVVKEYYPDHTDPSGRFDMVDVQYQEDLANPVTLDQIKYHDKLGSIALVKQSRLSVMPITKQEWDAILEMGR